MLKVTIELWPLGDESRKETLHTIVIANDGTGTPTQGNYYSVISRRKRLTPWKLAAVAGFPRKRLNAVDLLYRVLKQAVGDRNP